MPYKMSNGKWRGKRMINGQTKTKAFTSKRNALLWEVQQNETLWREQSNPTLTALEWANAHLDFARQRFVPKVYEAKRLAFKRLLEVIPGDRQVNELGMPQAMAVMQSVATQRGNGPANTARKHLSSAWAWGTKYLLMPRDNPFSMVDRLPADQHPRRMPTEEEFWQVFHTAQGQDKILLKTALHTAARKNELYSLRWSDIDFEGQKIRLGTRKRSGGGMEYDWIPMTQEIYQNLLMHRQAPEGMKSDIVFSNQEGGQYRNRFNFMPNLCQRAGVEPFGMHAIRHLSASILAKAGIPLPTIQLILRHRKVTTTALYIQSLGVNSINLDGIFDGPQGSYAVNS